MRRRGFQFVLPLLCILLALSCDPREWFFQPDERLTQLCGAEDDWVVRFFPVWSPSGKYVYFLRNVDGYMSPLDNGGALWQMLMDDTSTSLVLNDTFCALAISPNGRRLALTTGEGTSGGQLMLYDIQEDSLTLIRTSGRVVDVCFGKSDTESLYFSTTGGSVYRIRQDGSDETHLMKIPSGYFDLTPEDSVVSRLYSLKPAVDPTGRYVAFTPWPVGVANDIEMYDLQTGNRWQLGARPYFRSELRLPTWSPDGKSLIFGAHLVRGDPLRPQEGELWLMQDVLGQ